MTDIVTASTVRNILISFVAVVLAFMTAALLLAAAGQNALQSFAGMASTAVGSTFAIGTTLTKAVPRLLPALGIALALRAGLWNIGAEGQVYLGAAAAAAVALFGPQLPFPLGTALALIAAMMAGAAWAAIPGVLRAYRGFNEVITTLMMVYVAVQLTNYLIEGPWLVPNSTWPATPLIPFDFKLPLIWPGTLVNGGAVLAIVGVAVLALVVNRTTFGLWLRAIGGNERASEVIGVPIRPMIVAALAASGAFAGLAGAVEVLGVRGRLLEGFSPGYGFEAIAIALLGRLNPLGILAASLLFGALDAGAAGLQVASVGISSAIAPVIEGLAVGYLLAALGLAESHLTAPRGAIGAEDGHQELTVDVSAAILLVAATVAFAAPLIFAALGELISEKTGVLNIELDGMMLAGAFCGVWAALGSGSLIVGFIGAAAGGILVALTHGLLCFVFRAEQVVSGVVLNILVLGLTTFGIGPVFGANLGRAAPTLQPISIPFLSDLPIVGRALFAQTPTVYLAFLLVPATWWLINRTTLRPRLAGRWRGACRRPVDGHQRPPSALDCADRLRRARRHRREPADAGRPRHLYAKRHCRPRLHCACRRDLRQLATIRHAAGGTPFHPGRGDPGSCAGVRHPPALSVPGHGAVCGDCSGARRLRRPLAAAARARHQRLTGALRLEVVEVLRPLHEALNPPAEQNVAQHLRGSCPVVAGLLQLRQHGRFLRDQDLPATSVVRIGTLVKSGI